MKTIKTIFWDLDGTLINSEHIHNNAGFAAFKVLGINYKDIKIPSGMENKTAFTYLTDLDLNIEINYQLFEKWDNMIVDIVIDKIKGDEAIPQSIELFKYFNSIGIKQSVVSNSYSSIVIHSLKQIGIYDLVEQIFPRDTVEFGKPHPQLYYNAMKHHNQPPQNCLTFEDSKTGITAAKTAQIDVIGIGINTNELSPNISLDLDSNEWLKEIMNHYKFDY